MSLYCLVHGSTQGPDGWEPLAARLTRDGHHVVAPTLPSDQPQAGLLVYAQVIARAVDEAAAVCPGEIRVIAHSASGMFLPLVPPLLATGRPAALIYLAAYVPAPGRSLIDDARADPAMFNPDWVGTNPMLDEAARHFLFHDCAPERVQRALSTRRLMHAAAAMAEPSPAAPRPAARSLSILCTEDRTLDPDWSRRASRSRLGTDPLELPGGHCPHVSRPDALADLLAGLAETARPTGPGPEQAGPDVS